jgi:hypothetical protein
MRLVLPSLVALSALAAPAPLAPAADPEPIRVEETPEYVQIDTDALQARIRKKRYVSGIAARSFLDKKTGAREVGYGLQIMDFLMAPGWRDDGYPRDPRVHGNLPKHYIEGPQICTKAGELKPEVIRGKGFVAIRQSFAFTQPAAGLKAGSRWEQTLVFQPGVRLDMPGHIKHKNGDTFAQVYLSYRDKPIPASAFAEDFAPDAKFLYQRKEGAIPARMIRAYQVKVDGKPGPWLGGITFDPAEVSEAWCHQRGYVCFIQELHGRKVKAGETFGAAYAVGWFDDIAAMEALCDRYRGKHTLRVADGKFTLE